MSFKERSYRDWVESGDLVSFVVREKETDLLIAAQKKIEEQARESILANRGDIERYIKKDPKFFTSLFPIKVDKDAPAIVRVMADAAEKAGVGPMAAVAGVMAEFVGRDLLVFSDEIIVENGGDIFLKTSKVRKIGIYAGDKSPFTGKLAIEIGPAPAGIGVCTSSGTVSHSLSFGKSDATLIISDDTALADAVATTLGNLVKDKYDIEKALDAVRLIEGIKGALILMGDNMGSWGNIKLV